MIVSGIDGCLFSNFHRKNLIPFDRSNTESWTEFNKACLGDKPVMPVIDLVKHMANTHNEKIIFVTSRGEDSREETKKQLFEYFGDYKCDLHMRPMNNHSSTIEFKRDLFHRILKQAKPHSIIIDDHPGIIKMSAVNFPTFNRLLVKSFDCSLIGVEV